MKIGIIRCMQTEDLCPGSGCFKVIREKGGSLSGTDEDIEIVGFYTCGGCPGKRAVARARKLIERGADTIAFASCIRLGTPIGYACPFAKKMITVVQENISPDIRILDYTHDAH